MAIKDVQRYSTSLLISEVQTKTTLRYYVIPTRMAIKEKRDSIKCWREWRGIGSLIYFWWEGKMVQSFWKTFWQFLRKLYVGLPYNPSSPFLALQNPVTVLLVRSIDLSTQLSISKSNKNICLHENLYIDLYSSIIHNGQRWKQPKCASINEWKNIHSIEYYLAIKINEVLIHSIVVNHENIMLSKGSQTQKKTSVSIYIAHSE